MLPRWRASFKRAQLFAREPRQHVCRFFKPCSLNDLDSTGTCQSQKLNTFEVFKQTSALVKSKGAASRHVTTSGHTNKADQISASYCRELTGYAIDTVSAG